MSGPTIYAKLVDARLEGPRRELRESVERFIRNGGLESLVDHYAEALKAAYVAGVSDGFAQGVAVEAAAQSEPRLSVRAGRQRAGERP